MHTNILNARMISHKIAQREEIESSRGDKRYRLERVDSNTRDVIFAKVEGGNLNWFFMVVIFYFQFLSSRFLPSKIANDSPKFWAFTFHFEWVDTDFCVLLKWFLFFSRRNINFILRMSLWLCVWFSDLIFLII